MSGHVTIEVMIIMTTAGACEVAADLNTSLKQVVVTSEDPETLKQLLVNIELYGASEDNPETRKVGELEQLSERGVWQIRLDRSTFQLAIDFEIQHYAVYGPGEFTQVVADPRYREQIVHVQEELGLL